MISTLGFWASVSLMVLPIPLVLIYFGCTLFRDSYRSNLEKLGMGWYDAKHRANDHPIVRWTNWSVFKEEIVVIPTMILFVVQMTVYLIAGGICLVEGLPYASNMIHLVTVVSKVVGPIIGYALVIIIPFTIIPVAGKVAAKVTFFSAKIDKLGGDK